MLLLPDFCFSWEVSFSWKLKKALKLPFQLPSRTAFPLKASLAAGPISGHSRVFQDLHPVPQQPLMGTVSVTSPAHIPDMVGLGITRAMTHQGHGKNPAEPGNFTENSTT